MLSSHYPVFEHNTYQKIIQMGHEGARPPLKEQCHHQHRLSRFSGSLSLQTQVRTRAKIQSSRLDRILWSHRWWKVVLSQKSANESTRNSRVNQMYQVSQILLASSSGLMGVSCLQNSLFDTRWYRHAPTCMAVTFSQILKTWIPIKFSEVFKIFKKSNWKFYRFELFELYAKNRKID